MKRIALAGALLGLSVLSAPIAGAAAPVDTNPLGTLGYLPAGTNEAAAPGARRLVVVFDTSLATGGTAPLGRILANGAFGMKLSGVALTAAGPAVPTMVAHSAALGDVKSASSGQAPDAINGGFAGIAGDTRDADCSKVGTPDFMYAYSKTRVVVSPNFYAPQPCERIDSATPIPTGGWTTSVTTFTPGFWIDVSTTPTGAWTNSAFHYGAVYDTEAESGEFYMTSDEAGSGSFVGGPPV
jgi:hypothetical protein